MEKIGKDWKKLEKVEKKLEKVNGGRKRLEKVGNLRNLPKNLFFEFKLILMATDGCL